ncbi:MAG: PAC2 family protein, partial [Candidatus Hodarchaeota archaeon]
MNGKIRIKEKIELQNSVMIIGLDGWGNAGEVSTFALKYLIDTLTAKKFGEIPAEIFHDYLIQRPIVSIERGMIQSYISPVNDLFYWRNREGGAGLVLLLGNEPHLNWARYTKSILELGEMG